MSYEGFKCILSLFYDGRVCSTQHSAEIRSDDLHIIATRIERSNYSERGRDIRVEWSLLETEGRENAGQYSRPQYIACLVCVAVVVRVRGLNVNLSRLRFVPVHFAPAHWPHWLHWRQPVLGGDTADLLSAPAVIIVITALSFSVVSHSSDTNWLQSYEKMIQDPGH